MTHRSWEIYTGGVAPGGTTMDNSKNAHRSSMNSHAGTARPSYLEPGGIWYNSSTGIWYKWNGVTDTQIVANIPSGTSRPAGVAAGEIWYNTTTKTMFLYDGTNDSAIDVTDIQSLSLNDTTPSVKDGNSFKFVNTSATTVTDFDDGVEGQVINIMATEAYTTVDGGLTKTGMTIPLIAGDTLEFMHDGTDWQQVGGSVGMGRYVKVAKNSIGDWPSASSTSNTNVDVSDDGVRKGASAAKIQVYLSSYSSLSILGVYVGQEGMLADGGAAIALLRATLTGVLSNDCIVIVKHYYVIDTSYGYVNGYYI